LAYSEAEYSANRGISEAVKLFSFPDTVACGPLLALLTDHCAAATAVIPAGANELAVAETEATGMDEFPCLQYDTITKMK
jgi:hypothetical protein